MTISHTDPATLTKAVWRAADLLGLTQDLPEILDVDANALARVRSGAEGLQPDSPAWANAVRFTSLFRSLLTLVGNPENARAWLDTPHRTLGSPPRELLRSAAGRERVFGYLDNVQKYEFKLPPRSQH